MPLEALKCPQCGANVEVESSATTFFCTYCGTKLQTNRSSHGVLSAHLLSSIKDDTSIMAKRSALQYLNEQLLLFNEQLLFYNKQFVQQSKQMTEQKRVKKIKLLAEYDLNRSKLLDEAEKRSRSFLGYFRDAAKSKYYIDGEAELQKQLQNAIQELDVGPDDLKSIIDALTAKIEEARSRVITLKAEVDNLARHV